MTICLSAKRLIPFLSITYTRKAPPFAKITNIEELISKHYGTVYTDKEKYQAEVLSVEAAESFQLPGSTFDDFDAKD